MAIKLTPKVRQGIRKYLVYSSIVLLLMLIFLLFTGRVISIIATVFLIIAACLSKIYKRFTSMSIGFEFVTPVTILFAYKIGFLFAIIASVFMLIAADFISGHLVPHAMMFQLIDYLLICIMAAVLAGSFPGSTFLALAYFLIVFRNVFLFLASIFIGGFDIFRAFMATFPNIIINIFIISKVGMFLVGLL